jgi:hypothetical protein
MNRIFILGVVLACFFHEGNAQSFYNFGKQRTLLVSGGIGNATYFGDLKNSGDYFDPKFNITGGLQWFYNPRLSVKADLSWFRMGGSDKDANSKARENRNLDFKSGNIELAVTNTINLFELPPRFNQRPVFNAYAFAGLGVLFTNPTTELDGKKHALQPLKTEGNSYSRFQLVIPYGLGVRVKATTFFNVVLEGGYRKTFTDYLDDVSTRYPDRSTWDPASIRYRLSDRSPEIGLSAHEPGQIRGDPSKDDGYFLMTVKVEYYLANNFLVKGNQRKLYNQKRKSYRRRR